MSDKMQDAETEGCAIMAMARAGIACKDAYAALWPKSAPMDIRTFQKVWDALEVGEAVAIPSDKLPDGLEDVVINLTHAQKLVLECITTFSANPSGDRKADVGHLDALNSALCKNADVMLRYHTARQDRQIHLLNLRATSEKWRLELLDIAENKRL